LPPELAEPWGEWLAAHAIWIPLQKDGEQGLSRGGLCSQDLRPLMPSASDRVGAHLASRPGCHVGQAPGLWWQPSTSVTTSKNRWRRKSILALAALVLAGALPVHLTVLAPGELVAAQPVVLRAPLDGVIDKVHVQPNQMVRKGQPCLDWMRPRSAVAWKLLSRHC
jgi:hypothetical protein